jgi:hypothetical protein
MVGRRGREIAMSLCTNQYGDVFEEFVVVAEEDVQPLQLEPPITHALVVAKSHEGYLLLFNEWKQHWEVAGGIKEDGETWITSSESCRAAFTYIKSPILRERASFLKKGFLQWATRSSNSRSLIASCIIPAP